MLVLMISTKNGKPPSMTSSFLTLWSYVTMTNTSSSKTWSRTASWPSSEIARSSTWWNLNPTPPSSAQVAPSASSVPIPRMEWSPSRSFPLILPLWVSFRIIRKTVTLFSGPYIVNISVICIRFQAIHKAYWVCVNYLRICFKCMSQRSAIICNS